MASALSRSKPIENVWDALGRQVAGRNYPPTNKNTLIRALTEEWDKLPQQLLDNVVQSMSGIVIRVWALPTSVRAADRPSCHRSPAFCPRETFRQSLRRSFRQPDPFSDL
ncbi:hypothetical protein TNCV_2334481 [Trichonephila clavipes]|nr:hypothetical protein TNCV_2334481 [Trichonephila clavipes]